MLILSNIVNIKDMCVVLYIIIMDKSDDDVDNDGNCGIMCYPPHI